jgi:hypothetical protein
MVHVLLFHMLNIPYFYISTFRSTSMCAVPSMAVFSSSLILCFLGMSLRYFVYDFEMVPFAYINCDLHPTFAVFMSFSLYTVCILDFSWLHS